MTGWSARSLEAHRLEAGERLLANGREGLQRAMEYPLAPVGADDRQRQVLGQRQVGEHVGDLERAPHAELGPPVFRQARHIVAEQPHMAG